MTISDVETLKEIELPWPYRVQWVGIDATHWRISATLPDADTGAPSRQNGPWHDVPRRATPSQIVRAVFGAYLAFVEHEARETFTYRGARVFGPHIDVDALAEVAHRVDYANAVATNRSMDQ